MKLLIPILLGAMSAALFLSSCQSTSAGSKKQSPEALVWNNRIGNYTYGQAVAEFGTPGAKRDLGNGLTEYTWKENKFYDSSKSGPQTTTVDRFGQAKPNTQSGVIGFESSTLILLFDKEGKLRSWQKK